jgi:hypothetical protein
MKVAYYKTKTKSFRCANRTIRVIASATVSTSACSISPTNNPKKLATNPEIRREIAN